jgi:spermidine dehydrogenase
MKKSDRQLGMNRDITRRDFIQDVSLASLGLTLNAGVLAGETGNSPNPAGRYYPPVLTGMRGSHPGAFETAHALALEGKIFPKATDLDEEYDLIVVGGGISGLAAAYYYRKRFGADSRILILENHDDFGGPPNAMNSTRGGRCACPGAAP